MRWLAALILLLSGPAGACEGLEVVDAWIAEAPPGASVLAGYATLRNGGRNPLTVDRVTSREFESVMLHETVVKDGMAHMAHLDRLAISPGATVRLVPGRMHLMLVGAKHPLKAGDAVGIRLQCGASGRDATFTVRKGAP